MDILKMINATNKIYLFFILLVVGSFSLLQYPIFAASPAGTFDNVNNSLCQVAGWARDPDTASSTDVHIYRDGTFGAGGTFIASVKADLLRSDLPFSDKNHGFVYTFTANSGLYDAKSHPIYIYGIDVTGDSNVLLAGNPKTIICQQKNDAQFISQSVQTTMAAGQSYAASITIKNTGAKTWLKYPESGYYRIGSQSPPNNNLWGSIRFELPRNVAPGETATIPMNIITPTIPGTYDFQWRMVEELVEWFGNSTPKLSIVITTVTECVPKASISVKDCGAKGDGVNDDAPAIQKAINSVAPGGTVYIPTGTYLLGTSAGGVENYPDGSPIQSALIISKDNVTIKGDGNTTVLKLMPSRKMRAISVAAGDVVIEKITVDGNKAKRNGSVPWPGGDVVDALVYGSSKSHNMTVRFCEVRNGIEDGIGFWQSPDATVHDCVSRDNGTIQAGGAGISLSGGVNARAENNTVIGNTATGIWSAFGSKNVIIKGNGVKSNWRGGITIGGSSADIGLSASNSGFTITDNIIEENGAGAFAALTIFSSKDGVLARNRVVNNYFDGIQFADEGTIPSSNWQVIDNTCSNTDQTRKQDFGIRVIGLSQNITLRGNTCRDNGTNINHQIVVEKEAAVNSDWRKINTVSYDPLLNPVLSPLPPAQTTQQITQTAPPATPPPSPTTTAKESKKQTEVTQPRVEPQPAVSQEAASQIIEKQKNEGKLDIDSVQTIELKQDSEKQSFYEVKAKKRVRLFFFIPISMPVTITVNADAGAVEKIQEPWWGFLAF